MKLKLQLLTLLFFFCSSNVEAQSNKSTQTKGKNLNLKDLRVAEYKIGGISEEESFITMHLAEYNKSHGQDCSDENVSLINYAFGDLNKDNLGDAAAFVALNTGGSGYFTYLTILLYDHGKAKCVAWEPLGDRSQCKSLKILNGSIICDMLTHADTDPASMPSKHRLLRYRLAKNNNLIGPHDVQ